MTDDTLLSSEEYLDVRERAEALQCSLEPVLTFMPGNLEDAASANDFVIRGEVTTIRKVLEGGGVPTATLGAGRDHPPGFIHNKSHDWAAPIIFVSAELMKTSPDLIGVAIDLIRDYALSIFKGSGSDKRVKLEVVVERDERRTYQKVTYEGDVAGLETVADMVLKVHRSK